MKVRKWIVFSDTHGEEVDKQAWKILLKFSKDYKPQGIIAAGDIGEFSSISHWLENKKFLVEGKRLSKEIAFAQKLLTRIAKVSGAKDKIICMGNHERWVDDYVEKHPALWGLIDITRSYEEVGYKVIPENVPFKLGKLLVMHGLFCNVHHTKKTLQTMGANCLYGHTHDRQVYSESTYKGEKSTQSIGCMCNMNPHYMRNRPKRWSHGFATVEVLKSGNFFVNFHKIVAGELSFNGKLYKG